MLQPVSRGVKRLTGDILDGFGLVVFSEMKNLS